MKITFNGGLLGNEALCYQGREIVKQLDKNHTVKLDCREVDGYFAKFFHTFKGTEDLYLLNGHVTYIQELINKGHKNIISICVFETALPDDWVEALNLPEVKQVWTVSEFVKDLIVKSGVTTPVKVIYLGVDERFKKIPVNMFSKDKSFKFVSVCAPHGHSKKDRKGLDILIKAFKQEFKEDLNVSLFLKINTIYADQYARKMKKQFEAKQYVRDLLPKGSTPANIAIIEHYMTTEQLNIFYNSCHCGVFPTRAEGFGLPQAEMMKIGRPVITTDYSAPNEFSDPRLRTNIELEMKPLDSYSHPYYDNPFAEPIVKHLRELMRQVHKNYKDEIRIAEGHALTMDKFTWDKVRLRMEGFLEEYQKKKKRSFPSS